MLSSNASRWQHHRGDFFSVSCNLVLTEFVFLFVLKVSASFSELIFLMLLAESHTALARWKDVNFCVNFCVNFLYYFVRFILVKGSLVFVSLYLLGRNQL